MYGEKIDIDLNKDKVIIEVYTYFKLCTEKKCAMARIVDPKTNKDIKNLKYRGESIKDAMKIKDKDWSWNLIRSSSIEEIIGRSVSNMRADKIAKEIRLAIIDACRRIDRILNHPDHKRTVRVVLDANEKLTSADFEIVEHLTRSDDEKLYTK